MSRTFVRTLTFDLNIKIIFVFVRSSLLFDIGISNLAYGCIIMRQHVIYILDLCMILTFYLYVSGGGILCEFYSQFLSCYFVSDVLICSHAMNKDSMSFRILTKLNFVHN